VAESIKDLYWDVRPKPEYGTVEVRVCDTPLTVDRATELAAFAQSLVRWLLRKRPPIDPPLQGLVARYNKFQACRFGFDAELADPLARRKRPIAKALAELLDSLMEDARDLGCIRQIEALRRQVESRQSDARLLRGLARSVGSLNELTRAASEHFAQPSRYHRHD